MVSAGFIKDHDPFLGAERGDNEERLDEGGGNGQYRDEEPDARRPTVVGKKAEHRGSGLGWF